MFEIKGKVNTAFCYAKVIEDEAVDQVRRMCDYEFTEGPELQLCQMFMQVKAVPLGQQ